MDKGLTIYSLEIVNTRKVKCFRRELNGENMVIAGETGTGKTTAASAFFNDILKKSSDAITHGQKKGHIKYVLSNGKETIIAKRTNKIGGSTISIVDGNGEKVSVGDLKTMISDLSIDPHKIAAMGTTEQIKRLAAAADLGDFDIVAQDVKISEAEEARLKCTRQTELFSPGLPPDNVKSVDVSALIAEKDAADTSNRDRVDLERSIESKIERGQETAANIKRLTDEISTLEKINDTNREVVKRLQGEMKTATHTDTAPLVEAIANANGTNEKAAQRARWEETNAKHEEAETNRAAADDIVKTLRGEKQTALDNAEWPLPGLYIEDGEIVYNGCLFRNLGESEQILVCAALARADIEAHPIKLVNIDGVESMSRENLKALFDLFNERGIQVVGTRVTWGDTEPGEIVIVDGEYDDGAE